MTIIRTYSRLLAAGLALTLGLSACTSKPPGGYEGYVEGSFVYVASPQAGRLDRLTVKRGDVVEVDRPLFGLDAEPESSALLEAQQILQSDKARLADIQTGKRPPELDVIRARLGQALAEKQKSIELLKSCESQYSSGGVPLTDLITARSAVEANSATVHQYESSLTVAELPGRSQQVRAQSEVVAADRAAVRQAQWKLQQKQIAARRAGLVFDTLYREGEWVSAGSPIIQLLPPENLEVRFFVPETVVGSLKLDRKVMVHCNGCSSDVPAAIT